MSAVPGTRQDRIVVLDDDARIRDLLRRYLSQEGFDVLLAEDGKALNRLMTRENIDLIVLDLMLPGEDGLSICRRLRAAGDRTPIIMLPAQGEGARPRGAAPPAPAGSTRRARQGRAGGAVRRLRVRPLAAPPHQGRRADRADHRGVLDAQGAGSPSAPAAVARQARAARARPRLRALRPQPRRADLAPAQDDRARPVEPALHPDRVGRGLRVRAQRERLSARGSGWTASSCR